jgi:hypothetical protein
MTSYLGPVGLEPLEFGDALVELIDACSQFARKEWGVVSSRFTLRDAPPGDKPQLSLSWHCQRPGSYRLDLSPGIDEIWKNLKSDCRRNIRKAQGSGMEVFPLEDAYLYYHMLDATLRRHGTTSWHKERFFRSLLTELVPRDMLWAWGARYEGNLIAGTFFFHDDCEVHHLSGASLPQYGSMPTSYLLHWSAIEKASQSGLKIYNSDASRVPSIDQFKESFRAVRERRLTLMWAPRYIRSIQNIFISSYSKFRKLNSRISLGKERLEAANSQDV